MEAQGSSNSSIEFMDLSENLITRILCYCAPKHLFSASITCKYINKLLNSSEFLKEYQDYRHRSGCIITDNYGSECPEPLLYMYDIISCEWNTIAVAKLSPSNSMLNPQMVSACGGLILFMANKRRSSDNGPMRELVVVQLFRKESIRLPDPPFPFLSEIADTCSFEIVVDDMGSSYKVLLFLPTSTNGVFWVHDSWKPFWRKVNLSDLGIPFRALNRIVSRRSVLYRGVLYWLIVGQSGASCLFFYDTRCDALHRATLFFRRRETSSLCGIAVCGGKIIRVSRHSTDELGLLVSHLNEENGDKWEPLFESGWWDVFCRTGFGMAVCSTGWEDLNMFWMLCLVSKEKEIHGHKMLARQMRLLSCNPTQGKWQQLTPSSTGECDDKYRSGVTNGIFHRPLSQAKWINFNFTRPISPIHPHPHPHISQLLPA